MTVKSSANSVILILFAISDNLSAENSKLSADSWNRGNHLLGCMPWIHISWYRRTKFSVLTPRKHQHQSGYDFGGLPSLHSPLGCSGQDGDLQRGQQGYSQVWVVKHNCLKYYLIWSSLNYFCFASLRHIQHYKGDTNTTKLMKKNLPTVLNGL